MRARLRELTPEFHAEASLVICQTAAGLPAFMQARCVALFAPLASEPDIHPLVEEAWAQGKRVALPLTIKQNGSPKLDWHEVTSWDDVVVPGPLGLREPDPLRCPRIAVTELECAFIPGLAFDDEGFRLGRGGGFYDYFLEHAPANMMRVGLMFSCQRVAQVPREAHDHALPGVMTEDGLFSFA